MNSTLRPWCPEPAYTEQLGQDQDSRWERFWQKDSTDTRRCEQRWIQKTHRYEWSWLDGKNGRRFGFRVKEEVEERERGFAQYQVSLKKGFPTQLVSLGSGGCKCPCRMYMYHHLHAPTSTNLGRHSTPIAPIAPASAADERCPACQRPL